MTPRRYDAVVTAHEKIAGDVALVSVAAPDLPAWQPGDHADLELSPGLVRQYSFCGTPGVPGVWTFAVRLRPGGTGGSQHVHTRLAVGDQVRVAGPKAMFPLADAPSYLLVAGGIGVTPILTMAEHLASRGKTFLLLYVGSTSARMPFLERVAALGESALVVDRSQTPGFTLPAIVERVPDTALVYACGPARMLDELRGLVGAERLRTESFASSPGVLSDAGGSFEVQFGIDGPVRQVPAGTPMLDVLLDAGADVMWSCREGTCGTCETTLLKGEADHRDDILTPDEKAAQNCVFPCVSRALSERLVVDLPLEG
ncbi:ferredoxin [Actinoplanes sp. OR16]|uniref:PDR/VanB family oxidoreductase n=1 Tax=Actinoplanes sp. OR16 TaxID=946334 RepID=UPI000F7160A4|nr:PDR/VanB family oxidoreductase [Actinoplanes sp. OR16]BBH68376.1 ferredoxin [Actinoplanes sp. OR16]